MSKFLDLSSKDRYLLVKSAFLVGVIRLGLWLLPFRILHRLLDGISRPTDAAQETDEVALSKVAWAVTVASRYVPEATCLTQALATQVLLSRQGYPAHLRLGVTKDDGERLKAHAWVESRERIVIGGPDSPQRFTPLPLLAGEAFGRSVTSNR